jgi:hypothetical protein
MQFDGHVNARSASDVPPVSPMRSWPPPSADAHLADIGAERRSLRGPVSVAWREGVLTRAAELESLCKWVQSINPEDVCSTLRDAVAAHLEAAREAAERTDLRPKRRLRLFRSASLLERAKSNLDAAEALLLNFAPPEYVLGQMPSLLRHVQAHLVRTDPRRLELERIAQRLGFKDPDHPLVPNAGELDRALKVRIVRDERGVIVTAVRGASSAALREQLRLRSFRNVLAVTTVLMALLAAGLALIGYFEPTMIPLCFAPQEGETAMVVCPTAQSDRFAVSSSTEDVDVYTEATVSKYDIIVVELVGLTAASVAAAATIRRIRGSSERMGVPIALVFLKLPTGALTAFLGLLLMRGQFVPGLSALDTSAQILAWALVFGYAQQLFTRLVDQQGQTVLNSVSNVDSAEPGPRPS